VSLPSFASSRRCSNSAILFVNLSSIVLWPCSSLFSIYCMSSCSSVVGGLPLLVFAGVSFVSWVCVFLLISFISCYRFLIASSFVSSLASINVSCCITCSIYVYCYVYFGLVGCFLLTNSCIYCCSLSYLLLLSSMATWTSFICWFTVAVIVAILSVVISSITSKRLAMVSTVVSSYVVISCTMLLIYPTFARVWPQRALIRYDLRRGLF
jgi:hypothetical protein